MYDAAPNARVEVVRGRVTGELADELLSFWSGHGALDEERARERLAEVVCIARDDAGAIVGVNSVYAAEVPLVGGRPFWMYRSFILPQANDAAGAMAHTAIRVLEAGYDPSQEMPVGVCMLVSPGDIPYSPEVIWWWPRMIYAGHAQDGHEVRVYYFYSAGIGPPHRALDFSMAVDHGYTVHVFDRGGPVDADAVVDLWVRENAMTADEARRRVSEVLVVATHGDSPEPVGVTTVYLGHSEQLGLNVWYLREYVSADHRFTRAGWALLLAARAELDRRYVSGEDTRAAGVVMEVENRALMHRLDYAQWHPVDFTFIGETDTGAHVRVHFFPGVTVPAS